MKIKMGTATVETSPLSSGIFDICSEFEEPTIQDGVNLIVAGILMLSYNEVPTTEVIKKVEYLTKMYGFGG